MAGFFKRIFMKREKDTDLLENKMNPIAGSEGYFYNISYLGKFAEEKYEVINKEEGTYIEKIIACSANISAEPKISEDGKKLIITLVWRGIPKDMPARFILKIFAKGKRFLKENITFKDEVDKEYKKYF
jgi:hypothetical protein